jgi:hypothetical protein
MQGGVLFGIHVPRAWDQPHFLRVLYITVNIHDEFDHCFLIVSGIEVMPIITRLSLKYVGASG